MVKFLFWNCQGAESSNIRRYFREHCRTSRPGIVALLETRICGTTADKAVRAFGFQNSFRVEAHGFSVGIWILWKDMIDVEIITVSHQSIHGRCWYAEVARWLYFTAVYARPQVEKRRLLWRHLRNLAQGENEAWIMGGDFNSILRLDERDVGSSRGSGVNKSFADFIFDMGLIEVDYKGSPFT
ncbi:uncharacterized protein LOC120173403 [Hibiscus syriacus]|uniref:uncharacterized protein LOC120173403 n=1 Tax=Hibiscus syriacus TaxID=106335 RepID=UPI0019226FBA|nr:uncharacterized protein LOC120173403 [Hibiscus syriacus]